MFPNFGYQDPDGRPSGDASHHFSPSSKPDTHIDVASGSATTSASRSGTTSTKATDSRDITESPLALAAKREAQTTGEHAEAASSPEATQTAEGGSEEADTIQDPLYDGQGDGSLGDAVPPPSTSPSTSSDDESAGPLSGVDVSGCPECICAAAPDIQGQNTLGYEFMENTPERERRKRHLLSTGESYFACASMQI